MEKSPAFLACSTDFAHYVSHHKEAILAAWGNRVEHDLSIEKSGEISLMKFRDHLPDILDDLCRLLAEGTLGAPSQELIEDSRTHGRERWLQGYSLTEVLLEIDQFRIVLVMQFLHDFGHENPRHGPDELQALEYQVYDYTRELIIRSIGEFTAGKDAQLHKTSLALQASNDLLNTANEQLRREIARNQALNYEDPLTRIGNRRHLNRRLADEVKRSERYATDLTLVMLDLDHFKQINDDHGHTTGDEVLTAVAQLLRSLCRASDVVARFGGEEFCLILPDTESTMALMLAERIRTTLEVRHFKTAGLQVTASFGLAQWAPNDSPDTLVQRADRAMYQAKQGGRNRCCVARAAQPSAAAPAPSAKTTEHQS